MDLAVVVDGNDPDDRPPVAVTGQEHRPGHDQFGVGRGRECRPAESVVVLGVQVGDQVEFVSHLGSQRVVTVMVRIEHDPVLTAVQPVDAGIQVVEGDAEVPRVPSRRFQAETSPSQDAGGRQRQPLEPHQRRLLGQLVERQIANAEDRDRVRPVDIVVSYGVGPEELTVELTARTTTDASSASESPTRR